MIPNYYEALGIKATATHDEIKAAWRHKVKEHLPSKDFQKVYRAWRVLGNPVKRSLYDKVLRILMESGNVSIPGL